MGMTGGLVGMTDGLLTCICLATGSSSSFSPNILLSRPCLTGHVWRCMTDLSALVWTLVHSCLTCTAAWLVVSCLAAMSPLLVGMSPLQVGFHHMVLSKRTLFGLLSTLLHLPFFVFCLFVCLFN